MLSTISGKIKSRIILLGLVGLSFGQSAWNTGELSFNYGFPLPNQTLSLSGDLLPDEIPGQGAGGFVLMEAGNNLLSLVAYELYTTPTDTLADIFVIFMNDSQPIETGNYSVNPAPEALKLFVWLEGVDPESLTGLIDTSFALDSLASLNPYISISGGFTIQDISPLHFQMSFSGTMLNTSFQILSVGEGAVEMWNTLPLTVYSRGSLEYDEGSQSGNISGDLNPLTDSEGVGAILGSVGDTLSYSFISYRENTAGVYDVYGLTLTGQELDFPLDGSESQFNISLTETTLPSALPYMLKSVSVEEILNLLESGDVPDLDELNLLYLPVGTGSATFNYTSTGDAEVTFQNIIMGNGADETIPLTTTWSLTNRAITSLDNHFESSPPAYQISGDPYPNPFNSNVMLPIHIQQAEQVSISLINLRGQEVYQIEYGFLNQGKHDLELQLGATNLGGGIYFYVLRSTTRLLGNGSFVYLK